MSKLLSREDILAASDIDTKEVSVPEWGGKVMVKGLNGTQRNAFEASMVKGQGKNASVNMQNATAKLVALTIVDNEGNHVFSQSDVEALGAKSGRALNRVYEKAAELSGLSDSDMEEMTEGFGNTQGDSFTSN
jgi:hypothetical protein